MTRIVEKEEQSQAFPGLAAAYDKIGPWTEIKLDIVKEYASAYSRILHARRFYHVYVDAFAGAGLNRSRTTGNLVPGSPQNALRVEPPFQEYHFIDLDQAKVTSLDRLAGKRDDVHVHSGNCNKILVEEVFSKIQWDNYRRGLCLLDPYGLDLSWDIIRVAGAMKSIEVFVNFPIADINRNVLRKDKDQIVPKQAARMDFYWGDETWIKIAYHKREGLFGPMYEKAANHEIADAFRERICTVARFKYVSEPLAMKNSKGAPVYYLLFASHKPVAKQIVDQIFRKYSRRGGYCGR